MQENTKSRLTSFARFWPVSAIFFLTFCTGKYRPSINCDEESVDTTEIDLTFSINHESKEPNISDFVTAILKQEDMGEGHSEIRHNWEKLQQGERLPQNRSFQVDNDNDYLMYKAVWPKEEFGHAYTQMIEFCSLDFADGKRKLVVENLVDMQDGELIAGQYSGLTLYVFDTQSDEMEFSFASEYGADIDVPDETQLIVHRLNPQTRAIDYECLTPSGTVIKQLVWDGNKFQEK